MIPKHIKTLSGDEVRIIDTIEKLEAFKDEIEFRTFFHSNSTTVSFEYDADEWMKPYDLEKEYLRIVKSNNHETVYRIKR